MTNTLRINVLGDFSIVDGDGKMVRLPTRKSRALMAYLALHPGKRFDRSHLSNLLWGDQDERFARQSLRQALSAIRSAAGPNAIASDDEYVLVPKGTFRSDVEDFESFARQETLTAAERATAIYTGDLLQGHEFEQHAFDEWLQIERERLKDIARTNLANILVRRSRDQDMQQAIAAARSLVKLDPFDETAHRALMRFYARQGRIPSALHHFQDFSALLRRELGVGPDEETIDLYQDLSANRVAQPPLDTLADYAFVLEQMVHCVVVTDPSSQIVGWNKAAEEQFGFSKDFMFGQSPTLVYAPKRDQSLADNVFRRACEHGQWSSRVKLLSKDGKECYQTRTVAPLYDRGGALIGGFGTGMPS